MYKILHKQVLSDIVKLVVVKAPLVATKARAGQFVLCGLMNLANASP